MADPPCRHCWVPDARVVSGSVVTGQGVDRAGSTVGWVDGAKEAFAVQRESGLLQCAARGAVIGLWHGDDCVDFGVQGEDVSRERSDCGRSNTASGLFGFSNEIVDAGCRA